MTRCLVPCLVSLRCRRRWRHCIRSRLEGEERGGEGGGVANNVLPPPGSLAVHARVVPFSLQVNSDLYIFGETVKDYIALLASIKVYRSSCL